MINVAKRWGMTNIYRMKEIFGLVFINHEPGLERIICTLVLYDTNQKISYGTAYYCMVLVIQAPVSIWHMEQKKGEDQSRPIGLQRHRVRSKRRSRKCLVKEYSSTV